MCLKNFAWATSLPSAELGALVRECEGRLANQLELDLSLVTCRIKVCKD
jgi:hypothetical protein